MEELVSVIMSVYNEKKEWLVEAIESVLTQSYKNIQFIIVLDKPDNEELKEILLYYEKKDDRIEIIINDENKGIVESLNKAITLTKGSYIARMDADDICYSDRLVKQVDFLSKNKNIDLIGGRINFINEQGIEIGNQPYIIQGPSNIKNIIGYKNVISHPTFLARSYVYKDKKVQGYRNIPFCEDYDFLLRIISLGYNVDNISDYILKYRKRNNSITNSNAINQVKTSDYARRLFRLRMKKNYDRFKEEDVNKIINKKIWRFYDFLEKHNSYGYFKILKLFSLKHYSLKLNNIIYNYKLKKII